jgi:hypothetical protein
MARTGCLVGALLIVAAIVGLLLVIFLPVIPGIGNAPFVLNIQGALFCPPGHTYEQEQVQYRWRPGETLYTVNAFCVDQEGQRRSFTSEQNTRRLVISAAIFVAPFLLGLLVVTFTARRAAHRAASDSPVAGMPAAGAPSVSVQQIMRTLDMSDESLAEVKRLTGIDIQREGDSYRIKTSHDSEPITVLNMPGAPGTDADTLAERLKQLDEARDQKLLTEAEYQKLRKAILDNLTGTSPT